ncbi:hypothetical protein GCM10011374_40810 [Kocuria dechangensis]|uniref:Uncharacterized protein n=1 Tax=Kocuria dechangensis TaxID=1176249 RepID=A0A917H9E7_9MICC|nr:hypothetical protein GCM10011374_40810 [Kocuria dechangensis]
MPAKLWSGHPGKLHTSRRSTPPTPPDGRQQRHDLRDDFEQPGIPDRWGSGGAVLHRAYYGWSGSADPGPTPVTRRRTTSRGTHHEQGDEGDHQHGDAQDGLVVPDQPQPGNQQQTQDGESLGAGRGLPEPQ